MQAVIALINDTPKPRYSLTEMARHVNLSPWWLCHRFSAQTGQSPRQYQKSLKLQRAAELLVTTFLCVKEVMDKVGVSDLRHFTRSFKQSYGLTPSQYRQRHHQALHREAQKPPARNTARQQDSPSSQKEIYALE